MAPRITVPSRVRLFLAGNDDPSWSFSAPTTGTRANAVIKFDGTSAVISSYASPSGLSTHDVGAYLSRLSMIEEFMSLYTILGRRAASNLGDIGLHPRPLDHLRSRSNLPWLIDRSQLSQTFVQDHVPECLWNPNIGWFAEGSDSDAFGTLFLHPGGDEDVQWILSQVGMEEPISIAAWNDAAGLARLATRCAEDPDVMLTARALENSGRVRASAEQHRYRLAVLQAREHFASKKDQIRPRLVEVACRDARASEPLASRGRAWVSINELRPYEVFGYRRLGTKTPAIYAAAEIRIRQEILHPRALPADIANLLARTQENLDRRGLGTVVRVDDVNKTRFFVVKDPVLFQQNLAAFECSENATLGPISIASAA